MNPINIFLPIVNNDAVRFFLFTRNNPTKAILIRGTKTYNMDKSKPFKYITHGFLENALVKHFIDIKNAFLKKGDFNVILVDWSGPALNGYRLAAEHTKGVG